jgi:hypothetical protein
LVSQQFCPTCTDMPVHWAVRCYASYRNPGGNCTV